MLFLSIKRMHSIDNAMHALLNTIHAASYWMLCYNDLCKNINNFMCGVITGKYGNKIAE